MKSKVIKFFRERKPILGVLLIVVAGIFFFLSIHYFQDDQEEEDTFISESDVILSSEIDFQTEDGTEILETSPSGDITTEKEIAITDTEFADSTQADTSMDSDYIINPNFKISGLDTDTVSIIDNSIDSLSQAIQNELYKNGFFKYTEAISTGHTEIDNDAHTVTINFNVYANKTLILDAIYNKSDHSWKIIIW